jgi:hypothetical protein
VKKIREEIAEYWHDEESGRVVVKTEEKFLVSDDAGKERWVSYNKSIPVV